MFEHAVFAGAAGAQATSTPWLQLDASADFEMSRSRALRALLIADDPCSAREIEELLAAPPGPGHVLLSWTRTGPAAAERSVAEGASVSLLLIGESPTPAFGALTALRTARWDLPIVVLAEDDGVAVRALRRGAYAALPRWPDGHTLRRVIASADEWHRAQQNELDGLLNRFPLPAVLINEAGSICLANAAARPALSGGPTPKAFEWRHPAFCTQMRAAVAGVKSTGLSMAFALSPGSGRGSIPAVIAQVVDPPLRQQPVYLVLFGETPPRSEQRSALLRALWDVSPAEIRLTMQLVQGRTVTEAAAQLGIAVSTARTQLKRVLTKVGVRRQAELVRAFLAGPAGILGGRD